MLFSLKSSDKKNAVILLDFPSSDFGQWGSNRCIFNGWSLLGFILALGGLNIDVLTFNSVKFKKKVQNISFRMLGFSEVYDWLKFCYVLNIRGIKFVVLSKSIYASKNTLNIKIYLWVWVGRSSPFDASFHYGCLHQASNRWQVESTGESL